MPLSVLVWIYPAQKLDTDYCPSHKALGIKNKSTNLAITPACSTNQLGVGVILYILILNFSITYYQDNSFFQ